MDITRNNIAELGRFQKFSSKARNIVVKIFRGKYSIIFRYLKM